MQVEMRVRSASFIAGRRWGWSLAVGAATSCADAALSESMCRRIPYNAGHLCTLVGVATPRISPHAVQHRLGGGWQCKEGRKGASAVPPLNFHSCPHTLEPGDRPLHRAFVRVVGTVGSPRRWHRPRRTASKLALCAGQARHEGKTACVPRTDASRTDLRPCTWAWAWAWACRCCASRMITRGWLWRRPRTRHATPLG